MGESDGGITGIADELKRLLEVLKPTKRVPDECKDR